MVISMVLSIFTKSITLSKVYEVGTSNIILGFHILFFIALVKILCSTLAVHLGCVQMATGYIKVGAIL